MVSFLLHSQEGNFLLLHWAVGGKWWGIISLPVTDHQSNLSHYNPSHLHWFTTRHIYTRQVAPSGGQIWNWCNWSHLVPNLKSMRYLKLWFFVSCPVITNCHIYSNYLKTCLCIFLKYIHLHCVFSFVLYNFVSCWDFVAFCILVFFIL